MVFMSESDLYNPIKSYFERTGYTVRAEVGKCDMVAVHDDLMVAIELKVSFGLPVLYQALQRLPAFDFVYVAVMVPDGKVARRNFDTQLPDAVRLCRMLGIGFISLRDNIVYMECEPDIYVSRKSSKRRSKAMSEFSRRSGDHNLGGTTRMPRITAYREDSLRLVRHMNASETNYSPAKLSKLCNVQKASSILRNNVYDWFIKSHRGAYKLSTKGIESLITYKHVVDAQLISELNHKV